DGQPLGATAAHGIVADRIARRSADDSDSADRADAGCSSQPSGCTAPPLRLRPLRQLDIHGRTGAAALSGRCGMGATICANRNLSPFWRYPMSRTILILFCAVPYLAAQPSDEAVKKELKLFQGKWEAA